MPSIDEALDRVYEAALLPELWPSALGDIDRAIGTDAGILFVMDGPDVRWASVEPIRETMEAFVGEGWVESGRNPRAGRAISGGHLGIVTDLDLLSAEEIESDPFFTQLLRPRGWGWAAGTVIPMPTGEVLTFNFENRHAKGPVTRDSVAKLSGLRPHLARAALMACRLRLDNLRSSVAGLEALGVPAAVIGRRNRVLAANGLFDALGSALIARAHGKFALRSESADALVQQALADIRRGHEAPRSIASPGDDQAPPLVVHVVPFRRRAQDLFSGADALLVVTPVGQPKGPPFEVLHALFDLTPTEGRIARHLTAGKDAAAIAEASGLSVLTVRTQIKRILHKTGMHRQSDLVGFLAGLGAVGPR